MSRARAEAPRKVPFLLRCYQAQRAFSGAPAGLDNPAFIEAISGGGMSFLGRLRHPDTEVRMRSRTLRGGGRELAATDPFAKQFKRLLDLYVAGPNGTTVSAEVQRPGADGAPELDLEVNRVIDAGWEDFWSHPVTTNRRHCGPRVERFWNWDKFKNGEAMIRLFDNYPNRHALALQFVNADQVDSELNRDAYGSHGEIRMGIELDAWGAPAIYWLRDYPTGYGFGYGRRRGEPYPVRAYDYRTGEGELLHAGLEDDANQLRGLSAFGCLLETAKNRLDYSDAVLTAALRSAVSPWVLQAKPEVYDHLQQPAPPPAQEDETPAMAERRAAYYSPRIVLEKDEVKAIPPGWELNAPPSEHPTANYPPFIKSVAREYASGLGFTYEAIFNDRESVNYGSLRGGMQMDQRFVRQLQADEAFELLIPVRLRWLKNSMLKGFATGGREGILLPEADWNLYVRTAFDFEPGEWIDPLKDIQAIAMQLDKKLTSHTEVSRRFGKRWADVAQRIADDMKLARQKGFSLEATPNLAQQLQEQTAKEEAAAEAAATASGGGKGGS